MLLLRRPLTGHTFALRTVQQPLIVLVSAVQDGDKRRVRRSRRRATLHFTPHLRSLMQHASTVM